MLAAKSNSKNFNVLFIYCLFFTSVVAISKIEASEFSEKSTKFSSLRQLHQTDISSYVSVDLTNVPVEDKDLGVFSNCKRLRKLYLSGTNITNEGLLTLRLPQLEVLAVGHTLVDDGGFVDPSCFPNLEKLNLDQSKLRNKGLTNISKLSLKELRMLQADVSEKDISDLSNCRTLKILRIPGQELSDKTLAMLPATLENLDLNGCRFKGSIHSLAHLTGLRELDLRETNLKWSISRTISKLPNLEVLLLPRRGGTLDEWLSALQGLQHIHVLNFEDFTLTEKTGFLLPTFSNLEKLRLNGKSIPNSLFQGIGQLGHLRFLDLSNSNVDDASPVSWKHLHDLKTLNLGYTRVGDYTLTRLEQLPIEELELQYTKISSEGLHSIGKMAALKSLGLNGIANIGIGLGFLPEKNLTSLSLSNTRLKDSQLSCLAKLKVLSSLDLSGNSGLTDKSVDVLSTLKELEHLDLAFTRIRRLTELREKMKGCSISSYRI